MYVVTGKVANNSESTTGLWWNTITDFNNRTLINGMTFTFFGVRFVVNILPIRAEEKIAAMGEVNGFDFSTAKIFYRPPGIEMKSATAAQKRIELEW